MTPNDVSSTMDRLGAAARAAAARMAASPRARRDAALRALASRLREAGAELEAANARDLAAAAAAGLAGPLRDRLRLDAHALDTVVAGCL
jgi:glutamate-5-semialdehyde dehydrogenase